MNICALANILLEFEGLGPPVIELLDALAFANNENTPLFCVVFPEKREFYMEVGLLDVFLFVSGGANIDNSQIIINER